MATWELNINMPRRSAKAKINKYIAEHYEIEEGEQPCFVLGLFQERDENDAWPVFVCEFFDGTIVNIATELVKFTDTNEMGVIK